jgi:hypothetical protein
MSVAPVVAGLAAAVAFVVAFSMLSGPSPANVLETRHIRLTIDDLQSTYKSDELIIFSVTAKGVLDNACNFGNPSVVMRGESCGKTIYWLQPFALSTAIQCPTEEIDRERAFGDGAGKEIILDKAGKYSIIASYEDARIEKNFSVQ